MKVHYRALTENDSEAYCNVRLECLQNHPKNFGTSYAEDARSNSLSFSDALMGKHRNDFLLGAFDRQHLIGMCGFKQEKKEKTKHRGAISHMYVTAEYTRKGIAYQLLSQTLQRGFETDGIELITLGVTDCNHTAIRLYKRTGFQQYGYLKNYFVVNGERIGLYLMVINKSDFTAAYISSSRFTSA